MNNEKIEKKIKELTEKLDKLTFIQQQTNTEIRKTRSAVKALNRTLRHTTTYNQEREIIVEIIPGSGLHKGDKVDVLHPNIGQEKQGTVVGKTKDNLVKVETPSKGINSRLPKNLARKYTQA